MKFLEPLPPEVWSALKDAAGSYCDECPETGECWQYMGTENGAHCFRHRNRPESCPPIKGFAGKHCGRVYLHMDEQTLEVTRVIARPYVSPEPPAALADSRAIGERTQAGRDANRELFHRRCREEDFGGAFDGFHVTSDADPGL